MKPRHARQSSRSNEGTFQGCTTPATKLWAEKSLKWDLLNVTVTWADETDLRCMSWWLSNRPWLSRRGGGSWGEDSHFEILLIVMFYLDTTAEQQNEKMFVPVSLSKSVSALGPRGTDTAGSAELGGCRGSWKPSQIHKFMLKKKKCHWHCRNVFPVVACHSFEPLPTSFSSLANLSLSSSMVISSRGWGAKGIGHGGWSGCCNGGDKERLISCSRKADNRQTRSKSSKGKINQVTVNMAGWKWNHSQKVFSSSSQRLTSPTNFLWNAFTFGFNCIKEGG